MAAPVKPYVFSNSPPNTNVIDADKVNADFDALYNYLQTGILEFDPNSIPPAALATMPHVRAYQSGSVAMAHNVGGVVPLNVESFDSENIHDAVTNTDRLTIVTAGLYQLNGKVTWATAESGQCSTSIKLNGATVIATSDPMALSSTQFVTNRPSCLVRLGAGDYVNLNAFHNSMSVPASVNVVGNISGVGVSTYLEAVWLGP